MGGSCVLAGAPAIQRPGRPNRRICGILCREKGNLQKGFPFLFYTFKAVEEYRMDFRKRDRVVEGCNWLMVGVAAGWVAYAFAGPLFSPADSATGLFPSAIVQPASLSTEVAPVPVWGSESKSANPSNPALDRAVKPSRASTTSPFRATTSKAFATTRAQSLGGRTLRRRARSPHSPINTTPPGSRSRLLKQPLHSFLS